jgi:succinyl-CoA synthetase alpha subunit
MGILLNADCRLIIQGITGQVGRNAAGRMREAGTPLVGGVTPGRGGQTVEGVPVFDSCHEAVAEVGATGSLVLVPAPFCMDACLEAINAGLGLVSVYTDNVPLADTIRIRAAARTRGAVVLGPNSAGTVTPGVANLSDLNDSFLLPGTVGIVAKSGAITYEVADMVRAQGCGVSSVVCLGGDPVLCTGYREVLERFRADPGTEAVVLIGEIGGGLELLAIDVIADMGKPVIAHVLGRHAPPGKRMGHAGALVGQGDDARAKAARLGEAGAVVVENFWQIGERLAQVLGNR